MEDVRTRWQKDGKHVIIEVDHGNGVKGPGSDGKAKVDRLAASGTFLRWR